MKTFKSLGQKMFRTRSLAVEQKRSNPRCVEQIRQMTWLEVRRLWSTGLSGFWALSVFLVVGHAACHITGPSVILSVILAAITSALSGKSDLNRIGQFFMHRLGLNRNTIHLQQEHLINMLDFQLLL